MCDYGWDGYNVGHQLQKEREEAKKDYDERVEAAEQAELKRLILETIKELQDEGAVNNC